MSRRVTKAQMLKSLRSAGVEVPAGASVAKLRVLCEQVTGRAGQVDLGSSENNQATSVALWEESDSVPRGVEEEKHDKPSSHDSVDVSKRDSCESSETAEDLEDERTLMRLERRRKILALQRELSQLEEANTSERKLRARVVDFSEIGHALHEFNGDDSYGIKKWMADFEEVMLAQEYDDKHKWLCARRLLKGTAKIWLRTVIAEDWITLRRELLAQFDRRVTRREVYQQLTQRLRSKDESCLRYVLIMQEIASQADVDDDELVEFIVNGLQDKSGGVSMLYAASTVSELKKLLPRYEKYCVQVAASVSATRKTSAMPSTTGALEGSHTPNPKMDKGPRCFNCSRFGHLSAVCPMEKRAPGSCFRCGEMGHRSSNCPKKSQSRTVANVEFSQMYNDDEMEDAASAIGAVQSSR